MNCIVFNVREKLVKKNIFFEIQQNYAVLFFILENKIFLTNENEAPPLLYFMKLRLILRHSLSYIAFLCVFFFILFNSISGF